MRKTNEIQEYNRTVALSNEIAKYPPYNLTKMQYQALLTLVSYINSTDKPLLGIDDLKEDIERLKITDKGQQMAYVESVIKDRNTYRVPAWEVLRYFTKGKTPRGGVIKRVLDAVLSLNKYHVKSKHPDFDNEHFEGGFSWFDTVGYDKKEEEFIFIIGLSARRFLMGLEKNFLQLLAESTMKFDGKYSVPIFMYMKQKIYEGNSEFHGQESVDDFRKRFGLDTIKTYNRFYELERRILNVATADSRKSGDITFVFKGVPEKGSKKITLLKYHIYRIGNIHKYKNEAQLAEKQKIQEIKKSQQEALSKANLLAYKFLADKGVNRHYILDHILPHSKLQHPEIKGYEDLFFEILWTYLEQRSKAKKLAGALVSWWKKGILLRDDHFWNIVNQLRVRQKNILDHEHTYRKIAHGMTYQEYENYREQIKRERASEKIEEAEKPTTKNTSNAPQIVLDLLPPKKKPTFSFPRFQRDFPADYIRIKQETELAFHILKDQLEPVKYEQMLNNRIEAECQQFYLKT